MATSIVLGTTHYALSLNGKPIKRLGSHPKSRISWPVFLEPRQGAIGGAVLNFVLCAKELLMSYKADWDQRKLKDPFELEQFYELLDELVIEARLPRSSYLSKSVPDIAPENILLEILDKQIRNTVTRFIRLKGDLNNKDFVSWLGNAIRIVKNEIIGDAANRVDQKNKNPDCSFSFSIFQTTF